MTALRWTLLVICLLAALVVASLTAGPGDWDQTVQWARSWQQSAAVRSATCPVLVGEPEIGNARDAYARAVRLVAAVAMPDRERLHQCAEYSGPAEEALALLATVPAAAIQDLRRGVRMQGLIYTAEALAQRVPDVGIGEQQVLVDALLLLARHAESESERVAAWLDGVAYGWDLAGSEVPIQSLLGLVAVSRMLTFAEQPWLDGLSQSSLQQLAEALRKVDEATPVCVDLKSLAASMVLMIESVPDLRPEDIGWQSVYQLWQHGFSVVDAAMDQAARVHGQVQAFSSATPADAPWPMRELALKRLVEADAHWSSGMMFGCLAHALESEQSRRACVAELRLLRMAIAYQLGEALQLQDPLGRGELTMVQKGDVMILSSAEPGIERKLPVR